MTAHRAENVDNKERLKGILKGAEMVSQKFNLPVIYPIHPRTRKMLSKFKISVSKNVHLTEPLGYLDFLLLQKNAKLILTDSGGIQEEACIIRIPCITLRDNTERPETLIVKSNILAGANPQKIVKSVKKMINSKKRWKNPFGNGKAAEEIIKIIKKNIR